MKPEEIVSVMAAVLATAQQAPVRLDQTETAYDRIASQAWDLYHAGSSPPQRPVSGGPPGMPDPRAAFSSGCRSGPVPGTKGTTNAGPGRARE